MTQVNFNSSPLGSTLQQLLMAEDIQPGTQPGYDTCKTIYLYHPLGGKLADKPVKLAQSRAREISIKGAPGIEDELRERFEDQWRADGVDTYIANLGGLSRVYGISTLICAAVDEDPAEPLDYAKLWNRRIYFSVFDPLNTAGSLVLNLNPTDPDFLKHRGVRVQGQDYHRSRTVVLMNERPIYLSYTSGAFGFVGRSVYQRPLYPLKTFIQSMVTDDLVTRKVGVLVAKMAAPGGMVDSIMQSALGRKTSLIQAAQTENVIGIGTNESVESLDLRNLHEAARMARDNVLANIAAGADMPAVMLRDETFAEGFGEGSEDAMQVAGYIAGIRDWMQPAYDFVDPIIMRRAWNPEYFASLQERFPDDYGKRDYESAFRQWERNFRATWPSLINEPDSERVRTEDTKLKALIALVQVFAPEMDPRNKAALIDWAVQEFGESKMLFAAPLELDIDLLREWLESRPQAPEPDEDRDPGEPAAGHPFAAQDAATDRREVDAAIIEALDKALAARGMRGAAARLRRRIEKGFPVAA